MHKDFERLKQLTELSSKVSEQIPSLIDGFEEGLDIAIRNAPDKDKNDLEGLKSTFQKSFELAKKGESVKAIEIVNKFRDGRKNN